MIDTADLLDFANAWAGLGSAVQRQVRDAIDLWEEADVNPAAIELAVQNLSRVCSADVAEDGPMSQLHAMLEQWLEEHGDHEM